MRYEYPSAFHGSIGIIAELVARAVWRRQREAKGKQIGRKPTTKDDIPAVFYKHFPAFQAGHMNASEFARICGLSRTTVYKYLKLLE